SRGFSRWLKGSPANQPLHLTAAALRFFGGVRTTLPGADFPAFSEGESPKLLGKTAPGNPVQTLPVFRGSTSHQPPRQVNGVVRAVRSSNCTEEGELMSWFWSRRKRPPESPSERPGGRQESAEGPIVLSQEPTDAEIRAAVARWIELMACGDYPRSVASVFRDPYPPDNFRERVETFGLHLGQVRQQLVDTLRGQGAKVADPPPVLPEWSVRARVVPAAAELLDAVEIHREGIPANAVAWLGFHVPLDNGLGIW